MKTFNNTFKDLVEVNSFLRMMTETKPKLMVSFQPLV